MFDVYFQMLQEDKNVGWNGNNSHIPLNLENWNTHMSWIYLPSLVLVTLCSVMGLIANSAVILVFIARLRHSRDDRYFIPYLSIVDFIGLVLNMVAIWTQYYSSIMDGDGLALLCKLFWYLCSVIGCLSAFMLIGIAVQRYLKICRPCGKQMTLKYRRLLLIAALLISTTITIPILPIYDVVPIYSSRFNATGYVCKQDQTHWHNSESIIYNILLFSLVFVNISCLVILYSLIGRTIFQQTNLKKKRRTSAKRRIGLLKQETNIDLEFPTMTNQGEETSERFQTDDQLEHCDSKYSHIIQTDKTASTKSLGRYYRKLNRRTDQFTCMFMTITVVAMVSYIPKATLLIVESLDATFWDGLSDNFRRFVEVIYRLHVLHHTSNAFIYCSFDARFRSEIKNTLNLIHLMRN
ncbi:neuropeptide Y receptor type 6-like [Saccostrea echinata]|uniref:neuropeptide Y receptor type 6-like n=1 Tax=Saccostrea echinata TaxID=191078 RepID=UPI002A80B2E2|nr:neuropeptide Y receptor type 6-like [Saccostrea echinata]